MSKYLPPRGYMLALLVTMLSVLALVACSGAAGDTGPAGAQGPAGVAGSQGPQGLQGPQGPEGKQGSSGDAASAGLAVNLVGGTVVTGETMTAYATGLVPKDIVSFFVITGIGEDKIQQDECVNPETGEKEFLIEGSGLPERKMLRTIPADGTGLATGKFTITLAPGVYTLEVYGGAGGGYATAPLFVVAAD